MDLKLHEFLEVGNCRFAYFGDEKNLSRAVAGVSTDSRLLKQEEVYFALAGENHDGHDFVTAVFQKGALAAVVKKSWWEKNKSRLENRAVFVVEDTLRALQEASHFYRLKFSLPVLGLTGTNGKTTTKEMTAAVLSQMGSVCKTTGNLNNHIGVPLTLFNLQNEHQTAVVEMGGNHFGEIARLCEIAAPQLGLITNIGRGHLEFLGGLEGVARMKMELFNSLPADGVAFVNLDDPLIVKHSARLKSKVTFGFTDEAKVRGRRLEPDKFGFPRMEVESEIFTLNLLGNHNLLNALAAAAVGLEFGISLKKIKEALENVAVPGKRLEITRRNHILILNDSYNANPDSTLAALAILKEMNVTGKKIFVFGDMLELGEAAAAEHAKIGVALSGFGVDLFLAYGPLAAEAVAAAQKSKSKIFAQHFSDKQTLIAELKKSLSAGDALLVKGSRGMKMEEVVEALG
jgi:UDP-N-acetylmuramoyl-tripeptide--D-alanyl-D-alanine ligase